MKLFGMDLHFPDFNSVFKGAPISLAAAAFIFWITTQITPSTNWVRDFFSLAIIVMIVDLANHAGIDPRKHGPKAMATLSLLYMALDHLKDAFFRMIS